MTREATQTYLGDKDWDTDSTDLLSAAYRPQPKEKIAGVVPGKVIVRLSLEPRSNATKKFISRHAEQVLGVLSSFDRIRFRGTFRQLAHTSGMLSILAYLHVLLKDFHVFAEQTTARFRAGIERLALCADRPVQYLSSPQLNQEQLVQKLLCDRGVGRRGVIAIFSTVEVCQSYEIRIHGRE